MGGCMNINQIHNNISKTPTLEKKKASISYSQFHMLETNFLKIDKTFTH